MIVKKFTWDLDPYGSNAANLITDELQSVTAGNGGDFFFFIPKGAPYFAKGAKLVHVASGKELVEGIDWEPSYLFELVSKRTYMPVYGGVSILDTSLTGVFKFTYQTIGGEYTIDTASIIELLSNAITDPRTTTWEKITNVPWYFTPIAHRFDVNDTVGAKDLADKIESVADAIRESADNFYPAFIEHLNDTENPHQVTKAQVGLSDVSNFPMATKTEAESGVRLDRYVSVGLVKRMISIFAPSSSGGGDLSGLDNHIADYSNPHQTTKEQVGLGNVDNYATATKEEAEAGSINNRFMTPLRVAQAIVALVGNALGLHITDTENPHQVNKEQVGLSNVNNYATATQAEAEAGVSNNLFMTPFLVLKSIAKNVGDSINAHIADYSNPHQVNKAQVGLSNVDNYGTADPVQVADGTSNELFVTPYGLKVRLINLDNHLNDTNNPHQTTKEQVGLGSVDNYATATQAEAEAGSADNRFMTPLLASLHLKAKYATNAGALTESDPSGVVSVSTLWYILKQLLAEKAVTESSSLTNYSNNRVMVGGLTLTIPTANNGGIVRIALDHNAAGSTTIICDDSSIVNPNYVAKSITLTNVGVEYVFSAIEVEGVYSWRISSIS